MQCGITYLNRNFILTCNKCVAQSSGFSASQMESLARTINDTVFKLVENVMEAKINLSIEKSIRESLQLQLASINKQLKQHDVLLTGMKSTILNLQKRVEILQSAQTSDNNSLSVGSDNLDTIASKMEIRQRESSNIILYSVEQSIGSDIKKIIASDKKKVLNILQPIMKLDIGCIKVFRIDAKIDNASRPLRVILPSAPVARVILQNGPKISL